MQSLAITQERRAALSVRDAAQFLSVGRSKIYDLLKSGELRDVKIGGRRVILRDDIEQLLRNAVR
jgi:excisionase family DNA binding protein